MKEQVSFLMLTWARIGMIAKRFITYKVYEVGIFLFGLADLRSVQGASLPGLGHSLS